MAYLTGATDDNQTDDQNDDVRNSILQQLQQGIGSASNQPFPTTPATPAPAMGLPTPAPGGGMRTPQPIGGAFTDSAASDIAGAAGGMMRPQVQDASGRSPSDPNYGQPATGTATTKTGDASAPAATGDDAIRQWLQGFAGKQGIDPSSQSDPNYWIGVINQHGGLTPENAGYFGDRIQNPQNYHEGSKTNPFSAIGSGMGQLGQTDPGQSQTFQQILAELAAAQTGQQSPAMRQTLIKALQTPQPTGGLGGTAANTLRSRLGGIINRF